MIGAPAYRVWLLGILALGLILRLAGIGIVEREPFDPASMSIFLQAFTDHGLDAYSSVVESKRWPYPPGLLPVIFGADHLSTALGASFLDAIRSMEAVADLLIAWLVQAYMGRRGRAQGERLIAVALIALGPSFLANTIFQGQIDSLAILPAVAAVYVWTTAAPEHRAIWAGALIGVGAMVKGIPVLTALALAPLARDRREVAALLGISFALPALALAPFLVANLGDTVSAVRYSGAPGIGGFGLLIQPDLGTNWYSVTPDVAVSGPVDLLQSAAPALVVCAVAGIALLTRRMRPDPALAVAIVYLAVIVLGVNLFFGYLIWLIPFALMAGGWRLVAASQVVLLLPLAVRYLGPELAPGGWDPDTVRLLYVPVMDAIWLAGAVVLVIAILRLGRTGSAPAQEHEAELRAPSMDPLGLEPGVGGDRL